MTKMMLVAAVLVTTAACGEKQADTPVVDTTSAVAPMPADTMMAPDTGMIMNHDSAMARDSMMGQH